ncbi:hypothetical protein Bca52824_097085 [Brassica carinata]|uniref:Uncharacterized protein n=1 Tax=Brassica carinata TaxID=52824 RepID=A0A8X7NZT0_BRACI|nr:hypothetical protein Bca52824_097085 [Brassica carinata]
MKRKKEHYIMLQCGDTQYGIRQGVRGGSRIINEVRGRSTTPFLKRFSPQELPDDGLHYRHPWVFGVEEIERLTKRAKESEEVQELTVKVDVTERSAH